MDPHRDRDLTIFLDQLRKVAFVREVELAKAALGPRYPDALVTIETPRRRFKLVLEVKRTFLDRALTNALIAEHQAIQEKHRLPLLLAARYVPRPTGERLAEAGINFVDQAGNIHLKLGPEYHVFLLGKKERPRMLAERRPGPVLTKLLFVLLADPEAIQQPIRRLAEIAGIGKTMAAIGRRRLVQDGKLRVKADGIYQVADRKKLGEEFLLGYNRILRPHLMLGTFRAPEQQADVFFERVATAAERCQLQWALTGGPAAYAIDRYYRGDEWPLFLTALPTEFQRELRLVRDEQGPIVFLRAFGQRWDWKKIGRLRVAHPWLVYAELLQKGEPRAFEAAEQIKEKYLFP
jgi:hypothetical protein